STVMSGSMKLARGVNVRWNRLLGAMLLFRPAQDNGRNKLGRTPRYWTRHARLSLRPSCDWRARTTHPTEVHLAPPESSQIRPALCAPSQKARLPIPNSLSKPSGFHQVVGQGVSSRSLGSITPLQMRRATMTTQERPSV